MSIKTNFQKIIEFQVCSNTGYRTEPYLNVCEESPKVVKLRKDLIDEEFGELKDAVKAHDFIEIIDALADILYVVYGACACFGIDANNIYSIVEDFFNFSLQKEITKTNPNLVKLKLSDIQTEINKFHKSIDNNDFNNMKYALFGILTETYRTCICFGINPNKAFGLVHDSNMTKFCVSEEEAQKTVEKYLNDTEKRYDTPTYKSLNIDNKTIYVVYNQSTNKVLKSMNYKPVSFESMF